MGVIKKDQKQPSGQDTKPDSLWRKPITLDSFEDDDPLAALYRGREVGESNSQADNQSSKIREVAEFLKEKSKISGSLKQASQERVKKTSEKATIETEDKQETVKAPVSSKMSEAELKDILKIKSESFHFTDLREILRGKSFDIYAYLRLLSGDVGVCKIKHLDLMKKLDISRPTLFKQGEWLMRLSLIEKRNVPGDHLGTSYTVHRLEEVLPVPDTLVKQLESQIENFRQSAD